MDSERESERLFSMRLSQVMGDIGINRRMIDRRRKIHLRMEKVINIGSRLGNNNTTGFIFGSQSEATTTTGMKSDTDYLYFYNTYHVALGLSDWQDGKFNLLVLKNELTPPQHCYLQRLRDDCPLPAVQTISPNDVLDGEGRILVANTWVTQRGAIEQLCDFRELIRHGPSMTHDERVDHILAYHCGQLPEECKFMFHRPRPGHWPRPDTLAKAREVGVFLVPQGYTESPTKQSTCRSTAVLVPSKLTTYPLSKWQWRFSTSLMERFLMFDFSPVQLKTYTLVKIIRKTEFNPVFGDRFSTFHIKTAMLFTIENYPAEIWREDNIVKCVCLLLETLNRWLKQKYFPHFTISGVNLLVGKLHIWELPKLRNIISHLINTKLQCLVIGMDNINLRLLQCSGLEDASYQNISTRTQTCIDILDDLLFTEIAQFSIGMDYLNTDNSVDGTVRHLGILQSMSDSPSDLEQEAVTWYTPFLNSTLASMLASRCIDLGQPITQDIFNRYQLSFDSDLMSSRLKFASMLYCKGQYDKAEKELTYCEGLLGPEVWQCCGSHFGRRSAESSTEFSKKLVALSNTEVRKKYTMLCITFTKEEINCIPHHLKFEMSRGMGAEQTPTIYRWKENVVTDCIPFLHYLQHLTYMELHQPKRAKTALDDLYQYTMGTRHGHIDTAFNMLGHCLELQNRLDLALKCYSKSLTIYPRENASLWHAILTLHKFLHS